MISREEEIFNELKDSFELKLIEKPEENYQETCRAWIKQAEELAKQHPEEITLWANGIGKIVELLIVFG